MLPCKQVIDDCTWDPLYNSYEYKKLHHISRRGAQSCLTLVDGQHLGQHLFTCASMQGACRVLPFSLLPFCFALYNGPLRHRGTRSLSTPAKHRSTRSRQPPAKSRLMSVQVCMLGGTE